MDNKHYHTSDIRITENRAPTDDSVRILKEMESAAENKILQSVKIGNSNIEIVVHSIYDVFSDAKQLCSITKVNGTVLKTTTSHNFNESKTDFMIRHIEDVGKQISAKILSSAYSKLPKDLF